jgi:16S rRNA (cytidine1402-2'-O)-methyltransferase
MKGTIYLIPNTLGPTSGDKVLPKDVQDTLRRLSYFIVENERTARAFIKGIHPDKNQKELRFEIIDKQTDPLDLPLFLKPVELGEDVGIISEAGVPCVADPGSEIVSIAHRKGLRVVPLVGPSSILLALMASGFNGQQFTFRGYLPFDKPIRKRVFQAMIKDCKDGITQIFMETPYRNNKLMEELASTLHPDTKLCIAVDITLDTEFIATKTIAQWRNEHVDLHKRPTIFLID